MTIHRGEGHKKAGPRVIAAAKHLCRQSSLSVEYAQPLINKANSDIVDHKASDNRTEPITNGKPGFVD